MARLGPANTVMAPVLTGGGVGALAGVLAIGIEPMGPKPGTGQYPYTRSTDPARKLPPVPKVN